METLLWTEDGSVRLLKNNYTIWGIEGAIYLGDGETPPAETKTYNMFLIFGD